MGIPVLIIVAPLGLFVLNWLAVGAVAVALGLRRMRWGTPGGGAALTAGVLTIAAPVGLSALIAGLIFARGVGFGVVAPLSITGLVCVAAAAVFRFAAAARAAWRAADRALGEDGGR